MHTFEGSLYKSERGNADIFWSDVYELGFPGYAIGNIERDLHTQKLGIDRFLISPEGQTIRVEEKRRDTSYTDFLLEDKSSIGHDTPGWMEKRLQCDFIIYGSMPRREAFVFPYSELVAVWRRHKESWTESAHKKVEGFSYVEAPNRGYVTGNVAVPREVLLSEVSGVRSVSTPLRKMWGSEVGSIIEPA